MITLGTVKFDFKSDNQPFAQDLYGRWDSFCRTSFEKVVDDVLSRYDTEDEEIIIESLDLDLGTIEEGDFYERFPKLLAGKLDEVFSSYVRNKDGHPGEISIIPIRQSRLLNFIHFMTHGWWQWGRGEELIRIADLLEELIKASPEDLCRFLWENGSRQVIRKRLVFQFNDTLQERLIGLMIPADASFINTYVRFVCVSYTELKRPEIAENDFRDAVWLVVWSYLLSESKGYFSRKQMIVRTLAELAAFFNLPMKDLLGILTHNMKELSSIRLKMPELLLILEEIREETFSKADAELSPDFLDLAELKSLLSELESCRSFLGRLPEEEIYKITRRIIPSDSAFVVHYAQTLDKEREQGMLEGKAGVEFRIVKWVFIFQVIFLESGNLVERKRFVFSVLKRLASHYNLGVMELLGYFYRTLAANRFPVRLELRELIVALYLDAIEEIPESASFEFPDELAETLSNIWLCHRFLSTLGEEKIYPIVRKVIPSESTFVIDYSRILDKGKERGMLEGKAGSEFRVLKWVFIFQVVFSALVSAFSRKQFARSVLMRLASHYNLTTYELLAYFYKGVREPDSWIPDGIRGIVVELYQEMMEECSDPFTELMEDKERMVFWLEKLVLYGQTPKIMPTRDGGKVFAFLLKWAMELYGFPFRRKTELLNLLKEVMANRGHTDPEQLRMLVIYSVKRQVELFERLLDSLLPGLDGGRASVPAKPESKDVPPKMAVRLSEPISKVNPSFYLIAEEVIRLFRIEGFSFDETIWLECLSEIKDHDYRNLSRFGLLSVFWQHLRWHLATSEVRKAEIFIQQHEHELPGLSGVLKQYFKKDESMDSIFNENVSMRIPNAGLVIIGPFCPMLFSRMELLDDSRRNFKDKDSQIKAIFALQYLVTDQEETPECDLTLNKLLTQYETGMPLPRSFSFNQKDVELMEMLKTSILHNWDKMRNTSWRGFRDTFLVREGKLEMKGDWCELIVSEKSIDVLLDTLPWGFKLIKLPWMAQRLIVKWR